MASDMGCPESNAFTIPFHALQYPQDALLWGIQSKLAAWSITQNTFNANTAMQNIICTDRPNSFTAVTSTIPAKEKIPFKIPCKIPMRFPP